MPLPAVTAIPYDVFVESDPARKDGPSTLGHYRRSVNVGLLQKATKRDPLNHLTVTPIGFDTLRIPPEIVTAAK